MKVEKRLQKYLNEAKELTGDYFTALKLTDLQPDEILEIENKELKSLASLIYLCCDMLRFRKHEVCYSDRKFKVNLI
ncbi:MAG: hypothetical protein PHQ88_08400 [Bacteroides sp.]|nr:hypothetical protein [Bacteroides sp.]MDD4055337.1 hypothetical protein [Bacteroides sp.]MDD4720858.1 hypothetical protein [Bacteroides sp.]